MKTLLRTLDFSVPESYPAPAPWRSILPWLAAYTVMIVAVAIHHEPWRDELQAWMIAAHSTSLSDLFINLHYESHPALWYLLLYGVTRLSTALEAMQLLNVLFAVGAALLLLRYAPFALWQKLMLVFGYAMAYEFAVISRSYSLSTLLLFAALVLLTRPRFRPWVFTAVVVLLTETNFYGLIFAAPLSALALLRVWREEGQRKMPLLVGMAVVIGLAGAASVVQILPVGVLERMIGINPEQATANLVKNPYFSVHNQIAGFSRAWFPVPPLEWNWWNFTVLDNSGLPAPLSVLLVVVFLLRFAERPWLLIILVLPVLAAELYACERQPCSQRNLQHYLVLVLLWYWLAPCMRAWQPKSRTVAALAPTLRTVTGVLLAVGLGAQVVAAGVSSVQEWQMPFSRSRQAAAFIFRQGWQNGPIAGNSAPAASAVTAYLGRPIYYPWMESTGTFVKWVSRSRVWQQQGTLDIIRRAAEQQLVYTAILDYPVGLPRWKLVYDTGPAVVVNERYFIYRVQPMPLEEFARVQKRLAESVRAAPDLTDAEKAWLLESNKLQTAPAPRVRK